MTDISVVIPTYNRSTVLLQTIQDLLDQHVKAQQLILVDQTDYAETDPVFQALKTLSEKGDVVWARRETPSIPAAMNHGLNIAKTDYVLFLDDDIRVDKDFIEQHQNANEHHAAAAHVGQILQPHESKIEPPNNYKSGRGLIADLGFAFNSSVDADIRNCMAGNLCVHRSSAIAAGGFDERFIGAAYRFETEFCRRLIRSSGSPLRFASNATLHHLQASTGGTRSQSSHLTSSSGIHSMGDYYFALLESRGIERYRYMAGRFFGGVVAKFYLRHPWSIPPRLLGELRGLKLARKAMRDGQLLVNRQNAEDLS